MMNLAEYRNRTACLADFLPWAALVAPGVVLNKDGSFQRTARFRGPDLDMRDAGRARRHHRAAQQCAAPSRLRLGDLRRGAARLPAQRYPHSTFPDPVSALVDAERRTQFEEEGAHFESRYLPDLRLAAAGRRRRARRSLALRGPRADGRRSARGAARLRRPHRPRAPARRRLHARRPPGSMTRETLTYLHSTISTRRQRVRVPETPMHLDALLADEPLTGGLEPRLGDAHLRTLTIIGFPTATWPGLLDELNRLAFPYRWSTRAICSTRPTPTRLLTKIRRQWFAKRKSIAAILKEVMTNEASSLVDTDAANKAADADMALAGARLDDVGQAYVTATVTVWDEDAGVADEKLRLVEKVIQGRDFTCIAEGVNAVEAWLGIAARPCLRQCPPAAGLDPQSRPHDAALGGLGGAGTGRAFRCARRLLFGKTEGSTPFRFSLHVGDVGHTLVVGPTGAGKSRAAGADGAAVPALSAAPRSSPSISAARSGPRRSPWAATGTISAARLIATRRADAAVVAAAARRASMTPPSAPGPPNGSAAILAREGVADHARGEGASLVGADLARLRAGRASARSPAFPCCCSPAR